MTQLDDAVANVKRLGLDTSPFIYFVERHPTYLAVVREAIRKVDTGLMDGYSSVVTLIEVLVHPLRHGDIDLASEYKELLLGNPHLHLISMDAELAEHAAELRARYNLRTPDALQVATALKFGCEAFLTNDCTLKRVTELRILVLDELDL